MPNNANSAPPGGGTPEFVVSFQAGESIFNEGDTGETMFIIKAGEVEITRTVQGREQRLAVLEEGDFFGEMAILEEEPRMASARAKTECALLRIDGSTFDQMVRQNPEIPIRMLRKFSRRLRELAPGEVCVDEVGEVPAPAEPAPPPAPVTAAVPRIVHPASGTEFSIGGEGEIFIGRKADPATGFRPHIELGPIDAQRSTSRRHAKLTMREGKFFLREEIGVNNGTYVNGQRVATGVEVELNDGDEIRFGLVKTVLRIG
jgi:hypothetical protein